MTDSSLQCSLALYSSEQCQVSLLRETERGRKSEIEGEREWEGEDHLQGCMVT